MRPSERPVGRAGRRSGGAAVRSPHDGPHPSPNAPTEDELFFEKAEYDGAGPACAACQRGLGDEHYLIQGTEVCSDCTAKIRESLAAQPALPVRVILATLGGAVAAALSAAVWYGIRVLTGYEIGLIAIAAGFLVALAVRTGAAGNGGLWARFVALFFTYSAIAWSYIPDVMGAIADGEEIGGPIAYVLLAVIAFVVSYVAPILSLMDAGAIFAVAIYGFALWEAWRGSATPPPPTIDGPIRTGTPPATTPATF